MKKYILMLSLVLVLALVVIGVGYGYWNDTLDVSGTVSTTELSMKWRNDTGHAPSCLDYEAPGPDFANATPAWVNNNRVDIHLNNAYPGYEAKCYLDALNDSPLLTTLGRGLKITPGAGLTGCTSTVSIGTGPLILDCNELTIEFSDGIGTTPAPGEGNTDSILITVKDAANPSEDYEFLAQSCFSQVEDTGSPTDCFNEAPSY